MRSSGNTILVTGGGSGIGREMARRWHDLGNTVIVAGRTAATLEETIVGRDAMHTVTFDAADAAGVADFVRDLLARFPALNVLVNNAGIMRFEDISTGRDLAGAEAIIETNLLGPIRLTDALVDHLAARGDGVIVNVTSGLAFVPLPRAATYSASKAALHSYTQSLRARLRGKVEVIEVAPPAVQTELTPGQSQQDGYMPLDAFIAETMAQFEAADTPAEVLTKQVLFLRNAEAEGRREAALAMLDSH